MPVGCLTLVLNISLACDQEVYHEGALRRGFCRIVYNDLVGYQTSNIILFWTAITQP